MKTKISLLTQRELSILDQLFETLVFPNDFDLVYEDHVPPTGVALVEGKLELIKRAKTKFEITSTQMIGVNELLHGRPLPYGCRIKANSKVILLGKSQVLDLIKEKKEELKELLNLIY